MTRILIIDDEPKIVGMIDQYLRSEGFITEGITDPSETINRVDMFSPDLIILDIMMSPVNGIEILKELRFKNDIPIILLTAKADEIDKLLGLELGADDYVTKPFSLRELTARIRVVLRRTVGKNQEEPSLKLGNILIDTNRMEVSCAGQPIILTKTEYKILESLLSHPGRVFTRLQLLDALGETYIGYERTLDTHVSNLRKKLDKCPSSDVQILTVYGIGYKLGGPPL